jgi:hypothetical protein
MDYTIIRNKFWNGKDETDTLLHFNDDGFKHAIWRAFKDLTQRTMERKDKNKSVSATDLRDFVCDNSHYEQDKKTFLELLKEYFETDNYPDYNEWHKLACDSIITCLNVYYSKKSVTYGKAQKIVNMTMKGAYCLEGADRHIEKFKPCHMALDSFTLEWFYRCCNSVSYEKESFAKNVGRKNLPVWSNMNKDTVKLTDKNAKKESEYDLLGYYDIQERINSLVNKIGTENNIEITTFEAEFFIWPQMQITIAAEALYSKFSDDEEIKAFKAKNIRDKYIMLQDLFSKISHNDDCFI